MRHNHQAVALPTAVEVMPSYDYLDYNRTLTNSNRTGEELRVSCNRDYLDKQLNQLRKSLLKILSQVENLQNFTLEPTPAKPLEKAA